MDNKIKTGDSVYHRPSKETWLVAYADYSNDRLAWCGWPPGTAKLSDCELKESCTNEESLKLINELANMRGDERTGQDHRKSWALAELNPREESA